MARVLIVDDEKSIRRTLRAFLEREGHEVATADSADSAVRQLEADCFDVVVADIIMPGMDGLQLLALAHERDPDVEVILITGEPNVNTAVAALRRGAFDYLSKPLAVPRVCQVVVRAAEANALKADNRRLADENRRHAEHLEELVHQRTAELRESDQRFRRIFEEGPLGMCLVTPDCRIIDANATLHRILGYEPGELADKAVDQVLAPEDRERELALMQQAFAEPGPAFQNELRLKHSGKALLWARVTGAVIWDDAATPLYGLCTVEDITEQRRATEQVQAYQEELRHLTARLALAEEQERRRIAFDLHDVAAQNLALAMLKLRETEEVGDPPQVLTRIREAHGLIETTAHELRSLSHTLSPPMLYEFGLEAALETLARRFVEERGIPCRFEDDGSEKPLAEDAMTTAYRCACELLANTAKHAGAHHARLAVGREDDYAVLVVSDDGRGFDIQQRQPSGASRGGFGLFGIRERMRALRGEVRIESELGRGTSALLRIPLCLGRNDEGVESQ